MVEGIKYELQIYVLEYICPLIKTFSAKKGTKAQRHEKDENKFFMSVCHARKPLYLHIILFTVVNWFPCQDSCV